MIFDQAPVDRKVRTFNLSPTFLDGFKGKQPNWGYGELGYFTFKRCVGIETLVLCADLRWRPAGDLVEGQEILGFDEGADRHVRLGQVTHNKIEEADVVGIELEDGTVMYATPDHSWLVKLSETDSQFYWKESKDLGSTPDNGDVYLLRPFGPVWSDADMSDDGSLSTVFDSEGCLDRLDRLSFMQTSNPMSAQIEGFLNHRYIPYRRTDKVQVEGCRNFFPLLGSLRPPRLLDVFSQNVRKADGDLGAFQCLPGDYVKVVRVFSAGVRPIAVMSTSLGTHFTGGFASHNTYARELPGGGTEEWWQTCQRVVEGVYNIQKIHCRRFYLPWSEAKAHKSAQEMYRRMWDFKFLPPGRGLWMMGTDVVYERGSACLQNCSFVSTENISSDFAGPFCFLMDMSMLGVGVGADTRGKGGVRLSAPRPNQEPFIVEDSREGWVELVREVLTSFTGKGFFPQEINFSQVRKRGAVLKTSGGTSSGPKPLIDLVVNLTSLLMPEGIDITFSPCDPEDKFGPVLRCSWTGSGEPYRITSSQIVDIFNYIGKAVVAGGIRRSSEILFGDPDDADFMVLKQDSDALTDRRWVSNNSIFGTVGMDYSEVAKSMAINGEPGVFWLDNARRYGRMADPPNDIDYRVMGTNPCGEIALESAEFCNLVETFPAHHDSFEDYERTLKMAYLYAKTVTLVPSHDSRSNAVMMRNRRIGCSLSGIQQAITKLGRREFLRWCDRGYKYLGSLDKLYSEWLCIPRSIKRSTVKPSGTVSLLAGATPGIHHAHSEYYIRNVRIQNTSPLVEACQKAGYPVEPDVYADDTSVVSFPVHTPNFSRGKNEVSLWEQFADVAAVQKYWADNQVSATVVFSQDDVTDIPRVLETFEDQIKGISLLPILDHGYVQAPYIEIDQETYETMVARISLLDFSGSAHEIDEKFCDGDKCAIPLSSGDV